MFARCLFWTLCVIGPRGSTGASSQEPDRKVYVPNFTGDIGDKMGELIAAKVRATLVERGIQAFTYRNLADQLKQEETKSKLRCDDETSCVEELVSSFGLAERVFGHVTRLESGEYSLDLTWMVKSKTKGSAVEVVTCAEGDLPQVAATMALQILGLAGGGSVGGGVIPMVEDEKVVGVVAPDAEYLVTFESDPAGSLLELDGAAKGETPFSDYVRGGSHRIRMTKAKYETKEGMVVVKGNSTERWKLSAAIGWLDIGTVPSGLAVRVLKGERPVTQVTTPVSSLELEPGSYVVETADDGYFVKREVVSVEKGKTSGVALTPVAKEGFLKVKAFDEAKRAVAAEVWVGGVKMGQVPGPWKLMVGTYDVEVKAQGYEAGKQRATVEAGETAELAVTMEKGGAAGMAEGTWRDPKSGLTWQVTPTGSTMPWKNAKSHCASLKLDGGGWHLPTIGELRTLIRGCPATEADGSCNIEKGGCLRWSCRDGACGGCSGNAGPADGCYWPDEMQGPCSWYWSSSPVEDRDFYAWFVHSYSGRVNGDVVGPEGHVRCVR